MIFFKLKKCYINTHDQKNLITLNITQNFYIMYIYINLHLKRTPYIYICSSRKHEYLYRPLSSYFCNDR